VPKSLGLILLLQYRGDLYSVAFAASVFVVVKDAGLLISCHRLTALATKEKLGTLPEMQVVE